MVAVPFDGLQLINFAKAISAGTYVVQIKRLREDEIDATIFELIAGKTKMNLK